MKQIENRNATLKIKYPLGELLQNYIVGRIKFKPSRADVLSHSMATANLKKSEDFVTNSTAASKYIPRTRYTVDFLRLGYEILVC